MTTAPLMQGDVPILHETLGVYFQLETLEPGDKEGLARAVAVASSWVGSRLRWTLHSRVGAWEPYRPFDLAYIPSVTDDLEAPVETGDVALDDLSLALRVEQAAEYGLSMSGAEEGSHASPWTLRFWTEPIRVTFGQIVHLAAALRITVPIDTDPAELRMRALEMAGHLRVRWGTAGHFFSGAETTHAIDYHEAVYARARRHPGFDVGFYLAHMHLLQSRMRSVGWLTFVGPSFLAELEATGSPLPASDPMVSIGKVGATAVLQAGSAPERGDLNRLLLPRAYVRADELVRPVRASEGVDFYKPRWDTDTTERWLRRFERRLH